MNNIQAAEECQPCVTSDCSRDVDSWLDERSRTSTIFRVALSGSPGGFHSVIKNSKVFLNCIFSY